MDNEAEIFANTLKKLNVQKPVALYNEKEKVCLKNLQEYSVQSALVNISKQIKAFQSADSVVKGNSSRRNLNTFKTNDFLPLTAMSTETQSEQIPSNKFETQCVLDTQLINIIENAEALIDKPKNMTQEFDNTFDNLDICNIQNIQLDNVKYSIDSKDVNIPETANKPTITCNKNVDSEVNEPSVGIINLKDLEAEIFTDKEMCDLGHNDDVDGGPKSPILSTSLKTPLVFKLETFENFEKIALSVIKDNPDIEAAKRLINSQIVNNELFIQTHAEPVLCDRDKSMSPVLSIQKPNRKGEKKRENKEKALIVDNGILFSDDEVEFNNDFKDLPLTCALETSFHSQNDVLDKTMYVGFQTASNKSIQVHTDTYSKAKSILDNVKTPVEYISLTELVEVIDKHSKSNTTECKENDNTEFECEGDCQDVDFETEFDKDMDTPEFNTKSKRNFKDTLHRDDENNPTDNIENINTDMCNNKKLKLTQSGSPKPVINAESNTQINLSKNLNKYAFNTKGSSLKCHDLDEMAPLNDNFNIDEHIMKEFESNFITEDFCSGNSLNNNVKKSFDSKTCDNDDVDKVVSEMPFMGLKTANNQEIKISEQALAKTKSIFEDIKLNILKGTESNFKENVKSDDTYAIPSTSKSFIGFRTANNKEIKISEIAFAKTKNIFDNIDNDVIIDKASTDNSVSTKENKTKEVNIKINVKKNNNKGDFVNPFPVKTNSDDILLKSKMSTTNSNILNHDEKAVFKTASNKKVEISKEALAKTKNIFKEIMSEDIQNDPYKEEVGVVEDPILMKEFEISDTESKILVMSEENLSNNPKDNTKEIIFEDNSTFKNIGFKTASNKSVTISNEALERSKYIFQDLALDTDIKIGIDSNDHHKEVIPEIMQGFKTASNKPVPISKEALAKTKNIFQDIENLHSKDSKNYDKDVNNLTVEAKHAFQGFKTASEKQVTVTKEALAKSKEIFKEFEVCEGIKTDVFEDASKFAFKGFQRASNKPLNISENALAKGRKVFQDLNIEICESQVVKEKQIKFFGFQTASNKPVKISEDALAKTKKFFQDVDKDLSYSQAIKEEKQNECFRFQTASNKSVEISEDTLAQSRKLLQDFDIEISDNKGYNEEKQSKFIGFQTASNKPVKISDDALAKSKKVFRDLDIVHTKVEEKKFSGFQTASNKAVSVSKDALLKSKQIFEDIDLNSNFSDNENNIDRNKDEIAFGFKTANNKNVSVSEASFKNAKKIFDDETNIEVETEVKNFDNDCQLNIEELMNTEVIKNLEESLHTEDFSKETSPISKRSGSPILSCPKAKKRKVFKTPQIINKNLIPYDVKPTLSTNVFVFTENYKTNKKYTLKHLKEIESNNSNKNIDPYILNFKFDNLLDIEFDGKRNDIDSDIWSTDKIGKRFTDSVNTKIVPEGWIANHLKLIIWKLLSYEVYFPTCMENVCTVRNVLDQLKYRYDRELYNVERPALRKILEKDEVASKLMVLCVAGLYVDGVCVSRVTSLNQNIELSLTDGWYCVKACTDRMIDSLICDGKISVGTKLAIYGADLMNCEQGIAPWEDISSIRLKISGNSTRRVKWDTRLGFHGNGAILSHLSSVRPEGGKISRLRVFVTRVYPMLYVEKFEDGSTLTRSERLEHIQQMKHEADRQNQIEKLYDELEKMADQESQDSEGLGSDKGFDTGSQIYRHFKKCKDTSEFRVNLTESQTDLLQEHTIKKRDKLIVNLQKKVQDMIKKRGLDVSRNVVPLLKIRVADVHNDSVSKAMITIWRPNECLLDLITEGVWLDVYNVVPTAVRYSEIQISAGRQSIFQRSKLNKSDKFKKHTDTLKRKCYTIKDLQSTNTENEVDTIGIIFLIEPLINQSQYVYLADENKYIISVNFWGGIKKFGFENILDTGQVVACLNLQKRTGNTRKQIQQYRVTEFTHFTRTCKIDYIRKMTEELSNKFSSLNREDFINDCVAIKNNYDNFKHGNTENVTPYRLNNSDYNTSKCKMFIDSPLAGKLDTNISLSGLDFESTFKQTDTQDISPERLLRKRKVNERIAKLKMYGEPPPLSIIHIKNKSNAIKPYKSPLIPKSDISNVTSAKKNPTNSANSSPVNRTYVKSINPVKLNFVDDDGNTTDPFAEDFDCSPPLSLE